LARLRERRRRRGLRLMLDFVPNHTGLGHPWVESHPEYYITGTEMDLARARGLYLDMRPWQACAFSLKTYDGQKT
jgi:glycosidase